MTTDVYGVRVEVDPTSSTSELQKLNEQLKIAQTRIDELQRQMNSAQSSSRGLAGAIGGALAALTKMATAFAGLAIIIMGPLRAIQMLSGAMAVLVGALAFLPGRLGSAAVGFSAFLKSVAESTNKVSGLRAALYAFGTTAGLFKVLIGAVVAGSLIKLAESAIQSADKMVLLQARFRAFTGTDTALKNMVRSSENLATSLDDMGKIVQRFIVMRQEMGLTAQGAQQMADTIIKIGTITGADKQSIATASVQFAQAMASGTLQGDELRSILESMPGLIKFLAAELGVGAGEMKRLGAEGKLSVEKIGDALLNSQGKVDALYKQIPDTLDVVNERLSTQTGLLTAHIGQITGIYDLWISIVGTVGEYVKIIRRGLGDPFAQPETMERLKQLEIEIANMRLVNQGKLPTVGETIPEDFLGYQQFLARMGGKFSNIWLRGQSTYGGLDKLIEELEKQKTVLANPIGNLRKDEVQQFQDAQETSAIKFKKMTDGLKDFSKELKNTFSDLGMYNEFQQELDQIRGKFDLLRGAVDKIPFLPQSTRDYIKTQFLGQQEQSAIQVATLKNDQAIVDKINSAMENLGKKYPELYGLIERASEQYNIPINLVKALIYQESGFNQFARGPVTKYGRALGIGQFIPSTAQSLGINPFDVTDAIPAIFKYLDKIRQGNPNKDIAAMLAGYNAGPKWSQKFGIDLAAYPKPEETKPYVENILMMTNALDRADASGKGLNQTLRDTSIAEYAQSAATVANAIAKHRNEVIRLNEAVQTGNMPQEEANRLIYQSGEALKNVLSPQSEMIKNLQMQVDLEKQFGATPGGERLQKRAEMVSQLKTQITPAIPNYEAELATATRLSLLLEDLKDQSGVVKGIKDIAFATAEYNRQVIIAEEALSEAVITKEEYLRWSRIEKEQLEQLTQPNKKMIENLEYELELYRKFATLDDGERRINQAMAIRSAVASVNLADPNYNTVVDRIKEMTVELEAFKEQMALTNNQAELFKEAATGIYETWTGAFESIFDKGLQGFKDMKDQILALFKKLLAQMIATAAARPVMVPLIQTMGETFGLQGTARELIKQFGGPIPATAGTIAATPTGGGIPLHRQANDLAAAPAAAPGWAYGAAGLGGYMLGSYVGGGSPMSQLGGAGGGIAGAYLGSMVMPGVGTAIGAIVGGLAGTLAGSFLGGGGEKEPEPRARLRQGLGGEVSATTPFGALGFSELRVKRGDDQAIRNQGREFLQTVREFEESIAQVLDPAEIQRVKSALANFKSDSTDFAGILKDRISIIADAINLSYRTLLGDTSQMDTEAIAERMGTLKDLENTLTRTLDDISEAAAIRGGGYDVQVADTLARLKEEFDRWTGSTPQLQTINDLVEDRYQLELDRLAEIKSVTEDLQRGTADLLRDLEQTGMTQSELLADWRKQMSSAMEAIGGLTDPEKIRETVADYQEAAQAAFKILSDLLSQFDSARESITEASLSRATAIRRGGMSSADQVSSLQAEFAQRQAALQAATTPGEVTDAFNDLQTTLNDWLSIEQNLLSATESQTRTLEDLTQAIDDAKKAISQSTSDQARSLRYGRLEPAALIAALQGDFTNQQAALQSATTPEGITEAYTAIQSVLQEWLQAEQSAVQQWIEGDQAAIQAANVQLQSAEELQKTVDDLRKGLREFVDGLKTSDLSPLKPSERLSEARSQYMQVLNQARAGDTDALGKIGGAAQEYLNQAREFYASSPDYTAIFQSVTETLDILQRQFTSSAAVSNEEKRLKQLADEEKSRLDALAETFAQKIESIGQMAINQLAAVNTNQSQSGISALAETFAQRFELVAQEALNRLAALQTEQLGEVGDLNELADQFQSGIAEMTWLAQEQLKALQDSALARYQEFTAALDETLRNGAGVLSESLQAAFDAGAAAIADAVSGQFAAASQPTATIIPFPTRVAAAGNVATTESQAELERKLDQIVSVLGQIGVIVQVSTKDQTRELIQSRPIERTGGAAANTKQVF